MNMWYSVRTFKGNTHWRRITIPIPSNSYSLLSYPTTYLHFIIQIILFHYFFLFHLDSKILAIRQFSKRHDKKKSGPRGGKPKNFYIILNFVIIILVRNWNISSLFQTLWAKICKISNKFNLFLFISKFDLMAFNWFNYATHHPWRLIQKANEISNHGRWKERLQEIQHSFGQHWMKCWKTFLAMKTPILIPGCLQVLLFHFFNGWTFISSSSSWILQKPKFPPKKQIILAFHHTFAQRSPILRTIIFIHLSLLI